MSKYKVTVPFIDDMGSISPFIVRSTPMEPARPHALWHVNRMRDHDGLPHLSRLPNGTKIERVSA